MIEAKLGDIFDAVCDVIVIPCSTTGIAQGLLKRLHALGIYTPQLTQLSLSDVRIEPRGKFSPRAELRNPDVPFKYIAYATSVSLKHSDLSVIRSIGESLGHFAAQRSDARIFAAPLLGTSTPEISPLLSAQALAEGFKEHAPPDARLIIHVTDVREFPLVSSGLGLPSSAREDVSLPVKMPSIRPPANTLDRSPEPPARPAGGRGDGRTAVFISYSHKDKKWLDRLQVHLKPLEREGLITRWDDTLIKPGTNWKSEIERAVKSAKVAILLVSADFLASDYVRNNELPPLLARAQTEGALVLPLILSPCRFTREQTLSIFQAVNDPAKPLNALSKPQQERVLDRLSETIEKALHSSPNLPPA